MRFALYLLSTVLIFPTLAIAQIDLSGAGGGALILGETTAVCDASIEGGIRYDSVGKNLELCDASGWAPIVASTCDNAPVFPVFTTLSSQSTSTLVTSNIVEITGMDTGCTAIVGVSGSGSPEYRSCSDSGCSTEVQTWTSANNSLDIQGDYLQLRATTSASANTAFTITVDVGPVSSDWVISTDLSDCGDIGSVCADGTVYAGLQGGANPFYVTRCDYGMAWGGSSCTGARNTFAWNNGNNSGQTTTSVGDSDGQANTTTLIATDSDSGPAGTQTHLAAQACADLVIHGHSDWYLPGYDELIAIYGSRVAIGGFSSNSPEYYYSSSETSTTLAKAVRWDTGGTVGHQKYGTHEIRCARR